MSADLCKALPFFSFSPTTNAIHGVFHSSESISTFVISNGIIMLEGLEARRQLMLQHQQSAPFQ